MLAERIFTLLNKKPKSFIHVQHAVNIFEFIDLDLEKKAEAVFAGVLITSRLEDGLHLQLYNVHSFYVEVEYDPKQDVMKILQPFTSPVLLDPYLQMLELYQLF